MTAAPRCICCGTVDEVSSYGYCPACLEATTVAEAEAQGLPAKVTDPRALDPIATVLAHVEHEEAPAA